MNNKYGERKNRHTSAEIAQNAATSFYRHVFPSLGFMTYKQHILSYANVIY